MSIFTFINNNDEIFFQNFVNIFIEEIIRSLEIYQFILTEFGFKQLAIELRKSFDLINDETDIYTSEFAINMAIQQKILKVK